MTKYTHGNHKTDRLAELMRSVGYVDTEVLTDGDGDPRGVAGRWLPTGS